MPLPIESTVWPPEDTRRTYGLVSEWAAWWTGDPNVLGTFYTGHNPDSEDTGRRPFMFWNRRGKKSQESSSLTKLHVPVAGDLASFSSDLLFSEEPEFQVENEDAQTRLDEILDEGSLWNLFLEAAEITAALGGIYLRPAWDSELSDAPFLTAVHPDNAVPEWSWGRLSAVTFWEVLNPAEMKSENSKVYRHLERHEVYEGEARIIHGLYLGTQTKLGEPVPLMEREETAGLATMEGTLEDGPFVVVRIPGLERLDVEYVPNMRPSRRNRGSAEGRSDYEGLEGMFDALDETWTSWMRDIRLGQSRIIVPGEFLEKRGRGSGAEFDVDSEVFTPLEVDPNVQEKAGITVVQFALRTKEHSDTVLSLFERIVDSAGYAPQSFGLHVEGRAESGTALRVRERKSFSTQSKKRRYWGSPLEKVLEVLLILDREIFGSKVEVERPTIVWPDSSPPDMAEMSTTLDALRRAQAVSTEVRVRMLHPDWSEDDVKSEVERIMKEEGLEVEPPEMAGGIDVPPPVIPDDQNEDESDDPSIVDEELGDQE